MSPSPRSLAALALAASAVVFLPLLGGDFVWDDHVFIVLNPQLEDPSAWPGFFTAELWAETEAAEHHTNYYRPLVLLGLALDRALWGLDPTGHHLHSLLWHLLTVGLVWRLLRGLTAHPTAPAAAAAIFALHPVQTEVVAFVSARNDTMSAALMLGALILLEPRPSGPRRLLGAAALALAALLSKESAVIALPALLLLDLARGSRLTAGLPRAADAGRYGALAAALAAWLTLRSQVNLDDTWTVGEALAHAPRAVPWYAESLLWPIDLDPVVDAVMAHPAGWGWLGLVGLLGLGLVSRWAGEENNRRQALAGIALAGLAFGPSLVGILLSGRLSHRFLYLPMVGAAIAACAVLARHPRGPLVGGALAALLAAANLRHQPVWASDETLWANDYTLHPSTDSVCGLFRAIDLQGGRDAEAAPLLLQAIQPPSPSRLCCFHASKWFMDRGAGPEAIRYGLAALDAGCEPSAELLAPLALAEALDGRWGAAEHHAAAAGPDPTGYAPLVLSAAALRQGDESVLLSWEARATGDEARPLREQVEFLIARSEANNAPPEPEPEGPPEPAP